MKLFEVVNENNKETEFAVLLFFNCKQWRYYIIITLHFGDIVGLANLLNNENDYHDIANVIEMYDLKSVNCMTTRRRSHYYRNSDDYVEDDKCRWL
ncbi:DUF2482 family protein [Staphylococcus aureus]